MRLPRAAEFVVVGAGLLGLSAACALDRRGRDVLVLESAEVGHPGSGSKGSCRIFRLGYDDPRYVKMAQRSLVLWRELESETGTELLTTTGQLSFGPDLEPLRAALREAGAEAELVASVEAAELFPDVYVPFDRALFEPLSGVLRADACLLALKGRLGDRVIEGAEVHEIVDGPGEEVEVRSSVGRTGARAVICCAGPRTARLLAPSGLALPLEATAEQVAYFAASARAGSLPVVIEYTEPAVYGLPVPGTDWYKMGRHHAGSAIDVDAADLVPRPEDNGALSDAVARIFPACDPHPVESERCIYDNTPDQNFVLDRIGRVVIGCGTSGHGFKFGPLIGGLLADLALGAEPKVPIDWLSARRPALARA